MSKHFSKQNKKGFTLVEMLIVIAIIAVLVSILVPTALGAVNKAKAATDAANLKSLLAIINIEYLDGGRDFAESMAAANTRSSKSFPGAGIYAVFDEGGAYIQVYYVSGDKAYGTEYFAAVAEGRTGTAESLSALKNSLGDSNVKELKAEAE